jgi:hypothetical protein
VTAPETANVPRALTLKQPWAAAILWGGKDVENRSWPTRFRGEVHIHAGSRDDPAWMDSPMAEAIAAIPEGLRSLHGLILGTVEITGCVRDASSPWATENHWHWLLKDPRPYPSPIRDRGRLQFWTPRAVWLRRPW